MMEYFSCGSLQCRLTSARIAAHQLVYNYIQATTRRLCRHLMALWRYINFVLLLLGKMHHCFQQKVIILTKIPKLRNCNIGSELQSFNVRFQSAIMVHQLQMRMSATTLSLLGIVTEVRK